MQSYALCYLHFEDPAQLASRIDPEFSYIIETLLYRLHGLLQLGYYSWFVVEDDRIERSSMAAAQTVDGHQYFGVSFHQSQYSR